MGWDGIGWIYLRQLGTLEHLAVLITDTVPRKYLPGTCMSEVTRRLPGGLDRMNFLMKAMRTKTMTVKATEMMRSKTSPFIFHLSEGDFSKFDLARWRRKGGGCVSAWRRSWLGWISLGGEEQTGEHCSLSALKRAESNAVSLIGEISIIWCNWLWNSRRRAVGN